MAMNSPPSGSELTRWQVEQSVNNDPNYESFSISQLSQDPSAHQLVATDQTPIIPLSRPISASTIEDRGDSAATECAEPPFLEHHIEQSTHSSRGEDRILQNYPFSSPLIRDALLEFAYKQYDVTLGPSSPGLTHIPLQVPATEALVSSSSELLPLVSTLRVLHPEHLPTLLLLGCIYYSLGDFQSSLDVNTDILKIDPTYTEAMCNLGTTLKALKRPIEAFEWWWKALQLRPTYFEVLEIMLDMLLTAPDGVEFMSPSEIPRAVQVYNQAMDLCRFVFSKIARRDGGYVGSVATDRVHHLQKILYMSATIRSKLVSEDVRSEFLDNFQAIELAINPSLMRYPAEPYNFKDLVLSIHVAALLLSTNPAAPFPDPIANALTGNGPPFLESIRQPGFDLMRSVKDAGSQLLAAVGPSIPAILLTCDEALRLPSIIWSSFSGTLPGIIKFNSPTDYLLPEELPRKKTHFMTSKLLLNVAKRLQDFSSSTSVSIPGFGDNFRPTLPLVLLLTYFSLSLSPSAAIYNNLGILLSVINPSRTFLASSGTMHSVNGVSFARMFYEAGLAIDPVNPHLLVNIGSHFKNHGYINEAIQCYMKAVHHRPDFGIALANLANTIKDAGQPWNAITFYRRALDCDPNMPEAISGLAIASGAICDWRGRGGILDLEDVAVAEDGKMVNSASRGTSSYAGWLPKMMEICSNQLRTAYSENVGMIRSMRTMDEWLQIISSTKGRSLSEVERDHWKVSFGRFFFNGNRVEKGINEAAFYMGLVQWRERRLQRRWYIELYGKNVFSGTGAEERVSLFDANVSKDYYRLEVPSTMVVPETSSLLPFHTFSYPTSHRMIRLITQRQALRTSHVALTAPWFPRHILPPPTPPVQGKLNVGYVSSDFNDHPSSHLMQSVFGLHNPDQFNIYVYATSPSDGSSYRQKIEQDAQHFVDISSTPFKDAIEKIIADNIHILVNLNGYTKSARNELFAARPCPVQIQLLGFASTLSDGWCDYLVCDPVSCPRDLSGTEKWRRLRSEGRNLANADFDFDSEPNPDSLSEDWIYTEKFIYMPHTYMVTDHKQQHSEGLAVSERTPHNMWRVHENARVRMRQEFFPRLPPNTIIFANFNQLYKIDPAVYMAWLRILSRVPNSILWLLRFPSAGEENLLRTARLWAEEGVASRIHFTDVAPKQLHIARVVVADIVLDTFECNSHTVAADVIWSGAPIITWPKYRHKMCSRVCASILRATGFAEEMTVDSQEAYEDRAVALAQSVIHSSDPTARRGELIDLRRNLFLNRDKSPLFDTARWTRNLEQGYREAWRRWVEGTQFEGSDEWEACSGPEKESGCIWIEDEEAVGTDYSELF